jgi:hypothetical protein
MSSPSALRRFPGLLALALFLPLPLVMGCPFKADTFVQRCDTAKDCNDGNACTEDSCTDGVCENPPKPKETACGASGASVCDGEGKCIECLSNTDCAANHPMNPVCDAKQKKCVSCNDGVKNGKETDVDCGGPECGACLGQPCAPLNGCKVHTFCVKPENICCNAVCGERCESCAKLKTGQPDGTCAPIPYSMDPDHECSMPTGSLVGGCGATPGKCRCEDGLKNSDESDVDCGGLTCPGCVGGKKCGGDPDCSISAHHCVNGTCCSSSCMGACLYCNDNGQCTNAPPGYPNPACAPNKACGVTGAPCAGKHGVGCDPLNFGEDCISGMCTVGVNTCAQGGIGSPCSDGGDCITANCQNYVCM